MKPLVRTLILFLIFSTGKIFAASSEARLNIGDFYQGGIIFWLDQTQQNAHGLIVDVKDQPELLAWDTNSPALVTGATEDGAYLGKNNTGKIQTVLGSKAPAVMACLNNTSGGVQGWYLPSFSELMTIVSNSLTITHAAKLHGGEGFSLSKSYWSSTEWDTNRALITGFGGPAVMNFSIAKSTPGVVRCVRSF